MQRKKVTYTIRHCVTLNLGLNSVFYLFTFVHILNAPSLSVMLVALHLTLPEHSIHPGFTLNCDLPLLSLNQHDFSAWCSSSNVKLKGQRNTAVVLRVTFPPLSVCLNDLCDMYNVAVIYKSHGIPPHTICTVHA